MLYLALHSLTLAFWACFYALVWLNRSLAVQHALANLMYLGVLAAPLTFFLLILNITRQGEWLTPQRFALFLIEPIFVLAALWSNDLHHLYFSRFANYTMGGLVYLDVQRGPLAWGNLLYSYGLLAAALAALLRAYLLGSPLFRLQFVGLLAGACLPWAGNLANLLRLIPIPGLDITPIVLGISAILFLYALLPRQRYDLLPSARSRLLQDSSDGLMVWDARFRILDMNPAAATLLNVSSMDIKGKSALPLFPAWADLADELSTRKQEWRAELPGQADPSRYFDIKVTPLSDRVAVSGYIVIFRDISERRQAEERLRQTNRELNERLREIESLQKRLREQATRDPLTNLYNRRYLEEVLEKELARAERKGKPVSIIMMDADKFKSINDHFGHKAGDQALQGLARLIQLHVRRSDIACRYGGEEFVIVMPDTEIPVAVMRAESIRQDFRDSDFLGPGTSGRASLSIGVASYPVTALTGEDLLDAADQAMYAAKLAGGNRIRIRKKPVKKQPPPAKQPVEGNPGAHSSPQSTEHKPKI